VQARAVRGHEDETAHVFHGLALEDFDFGALHINLHEGGRATGPALHERVHGPRLDFPGATAQRTAAGAAAAESRDAIVGGNGVGKNCHIFQTIPGDVMVQIPAIVRVGFEGQALTLRRAARREQGIIAEMGSDIPEHIIGQQRRRDKVGHHGFIDAAEVIGSRGQAPNQSRARPGLNRDANVPREFARDGFKNMFHGLAAGQWLEKWCRSTAQRGGIGHAALVVIQVFVREIGGVHHRGGWPSRSE
jgi:hypothetical protein